MKRVSKGKFTDFQKKLDNMVIFYDELGIFVGGLKQIVDSLNGMMYGIGSGVVEVLGISLSRETKQDFKLLRKYRKYLKLFPETENISEPPAKEPAEPAPPVTALVEVPDAAAPVAASISDESEPPDAAPDAAAVTDVDVSETPVEELTGETCESIETENATP